MADVVQRFFHRSDLMIPEQAYQERPDPDKKCCGRCKKIRENDGRRIAKMRLIKK